MNVQEARQEVEGTWNWRTVRDWIAEMVILEPKIMRRVSNARFGNLGNWIQRGSGNVGSMKHPALSARLAAGWLGETLGNAVAVDLIKDEIRKKLLLRAKHIRGGLKRSRAAKRKADGTFKVG